MATAGEKASKIKARRERFDLTRTAGRILFDSGLDAALQHRTVWCHRTIKNESGNAYIWRREDGSSARLTGVTTCGNVWTCPVCSARVAERRREELQTALRLWLSEEGRDVYLLTLTFPHERCQQLADTSDAFGKAMTRWRNSRAYKRILGTASKPGRYKRAGSVRSIEVTWGPEHGWHPHCHSLEFADAGLIDDAAAMQDLRDAWIAALLKSGLGDRSRLRWMQEHALDIRGGRYAAEYIAKMGTSGRWDLASELTRQHAKQGMRSTAAHAGHCTPFQILAWAAAGDDEAIHLFREYSLAMAGKRMLSWSAGLKKKMHLDDVDDEAIAADETPLAAEHQVATITVDDLSLITSRAALGELIEFVCILDGTDMQACVADFLDDLRRRAPLGRGTVRAKMWRLPSFYVTEGTR